MKNKNILVIIIIIIIIAIGFFVFDKQEKEPIANNTLETELQTPVVFIDPVSKESVTIVFTKDGKGATLQGLGYDSLLLNIAVSGSGARYVNDDQKIEAWNRGENITISKDGKEIFSGNVGGKTDADELMSSTWVWQATTIDDKVTEPEDKDAFTITFAKDNTMNATTDCNSIFGQYSIENNNSISFGALGMTKKFCQDSQESIFANNLSRVKSFRFNGSGALVLELGTDMDSMLFSKK